MFTKQSLNGFTIIEVLIVLSISGLILLLSLYMIPTLQRNSRNSSKKNDISVIFDQLSTFQSNHSGAMPTALDDFLRHANLSYYDKSSVSFTDVNSPSLSSDITIVTATGGIANITNAYTDVDKVAIFNYRKCNPDMTGATSNTAGYRDIVALYAIETRTGSESKCKFL